MVGTSFKLKQLLGLIAFVGIGCVALANANRIWAGVFFGVTSLLLGAFTVASLVLRGRQQAVSIGFAVFAWLHVALTETQLTDFYYYDELFPTQAAVDWCHRLIRTEIPGVGEYPDYVPPMDEFRLIGSCLWSVLFGFAGGHFGGLLYGARRLDDGGTGCT